MQEATAKRETLTGQAYARLEEMIVTLELTPGIFISEQALADSSGFGRTPVREALQGLQREGLITVLPRRGILVTEVDAQEQLLVVEVRRELERLLSRTAARRATEPQREVITAIAEGMDAASRSNDAIAFLRLDLELNQGVLAAAHNPFAARAMRVLGGLSRRFWYRHYQDAADLPLCARLHAAQARAIANGDEKAAALASDALLDYVEAFTRAAAAGR